ncbi:MAG: Kazal-type serine protease inhibitor domain-containing protein [Sandaracinaceae bacterium]
MRALGISPLRRLLALPARARWLVALPLALAGCSLVHIGGDDGGADAGPLPSDGGGVTCGRVVCGEGMVCCNASCGICTLPDQGCTAIECVDSCTSNADCAPGQYCAVGQGCPSAANEGTCMPIPDPICPAVVDPVCGCDGVTHENSCAAISSGVNIAYDGECTAGCEPDDARGVGACAAIVGVAWNGTECIALGGCSCEGTDCDRYDSMDDCIGQHLACGGDGCGSDADCPSGEWCHFVETGACVTGRGGVCEGPPPPGGPCDPTDEEVCGCDGVTYGCEREALTAQVSILHTGACGTGVCAPQDAHGEDPLCPAIWGVRWNGVACEYVGGCGCTGADCGSLYPDPESCERATAACTADSCGGLLGQMCRPSQFCDYPDSFFCGGFDGTGTCMPRPEVCDATVDPVCGCDGATYTNACMANMAGVDVNHTGGC